MAPVVMAAAYAMLVETMLMCLAFVVAHYVHGNHPLIPDLFTFKT